MNAPEAEIVRIQSGKSFAYRLMIGPWPIITCHRRAVADAVLSILQDCYATLPQWRPVDLLALAGYGAIACVDTHKRRPLSYTWSRAATQQWYSHFAPRTGVESITIVDEGALTIALAQGGQILGDVETR